MSIEPLPLFPNYMQLRTRSRLPAKLWPWIRIGSVVFTVALVVVLIVVPQTGLFIFWRLLIPLLPVLFLVAPGLWRNICPLAASNQTPRVFAFTRGLTPPAWLKEYGYVIGFGAFFLAAASRKWLFNSDGLATALLILAALAAAFLGGLVFKGKSGWCSSMCPLLPVQRLYNQTPFVTVANSHCTPCVGCTKNCYDFNPGVAYLADLYDDDRYYSGYRKFFAAAMPGFILAYFTLPDPALSAVPVMYLWFALYMLVSVGVFFVLDAFVKVTTNHLTALCGAAALNLFYWFGLPTWLNAVGSLAGVTPPVWLAWIGQAAILVLTVIWLARTFAKEPLFLGQVMQQEETRITPGAARVLRKATQQDKAEITFLPSEVRVLAEAGRTLLEIAESNHQPLEAGCRMGMCGADPVVILSGMENLSALNAEERSTLERLGLSGQARMACMCRVKGPVAVSLDITQAQAAAARAATAFDPAIKSVVVVGNGIAGVTAADYVRRQHPECAIHLVGREKHHLYNRMAITRLIYGRSAMSGLYLQPDTWYDERKITCWLNTQVTGIASDTRSVTLATGETLPYDRLILTSGSASFVPPMAGFGMPGTFVLREAEEAMEIRAFVQEHQCRRAVIGGGGLLGLEAGYALHKLGMAVSILERGEWLLRRQLDERASTFLRQYLEALGIDVVMQAETDAPLGNGRISEVRLKDGRTLPCDLLLIAVGIKPNVDLARAAGLDVNRGVIVDAAMRTSTADVYAAGDVCEFEKQVPGLWPVAVEQARVAAVNAMGGQEVYREIVPVTTLKVVGIDITSIGRFEPRSGAESVIALEDISEHRYRKLVIAAGKIVGAILLGYPAYAPAVTAAVKSSTDVSAQLDDLRAGRWEVLERLSEGG
jgi:NADPH-dependent 2,4-dienoyl-CoA reductase/sulfur reductase-like enzyme/ferredoxin